MKMLRDDHPPAFMRQRGKAALQAAGINASDDEAWRTALAILRRHAESDWSACFDSLRRTRPEFFVR